MQAAMLHPGRPERRGGHPVASAEVNDEAAATPSAWPDIEVEPYRRRRDWRWWVGGVGRVLVAVGLLLLAFVAYQLWGTSIQTRQAQNRLEQQFAETVSSSPSAATTTVPTTVAGPTTSAAATTTTTTAPPATLPVPALGDPVARLEAPSIGLDWIVVSGVGVDELKKGPGHYPDTPLPGQGGNVGIAGHRTTYGAPFFRIDELAPGDDVILTSTTGDRFVYKVTEQFIVSPSQYEVLAPSDQPILTLTSCHPRYSASKRIIVRAALDPAQSAPLLDAAPHHDHHDVTTAPTTSAAGPGLHGRPGHARADDDGSPPGGRDRRARAGAGLVRRSRRLAAGGVLGPGPHRDRAPRLDGSAAAPDTTGSARSPASCPSSCASTSSSRTSTGCCPRTSE